MKNQDTDAEPVSSRTRSHHTASKKPTPSSGSEETTKKKRTREPATKVEEEEEEEGDRDRQQRIVKEGVNPKRPKRTSITEQDQKSYESEESSTEDHQKDEHQQKEEEVTISSVTINRAPVLTLWVAVVAESQGYSWDEALTFGKYISSMLAQSKGRHIGIYEERTKTEEEREEKRRKREGKGVRQIQVFGMTVPVIDTDDGVRAISSGTIAMNPRSVERYLEKSFGSKLNAARDAMRFLAESVPSIREPSSREPYRLYEEFRPSVPGGRAGWGRRGILDLDHIRSLATSIGFNATTDVAVVKPKRTKIEKAKAAAEV